MSLLRSQADQGIDFPPGLSSWLDVTGQLRPERRGDAPAEWLRIRSHLELRADFVSKEHFFHLTLALVPEATPEGQRAFLETAVELLPDEGHRQVLLCTLSMLAARLGDTSSAQEWLQSCDPRPFDLNMDSAYRCAMALLATVNDRPPAVIEILGSRPGDVPVARRYFVTCALLQAQAREAVGDVSGVDQCLDTLVSEEGEATVFEALDALRPLALCVRWRRDYRVRKLRRLQQRFRYLEPTALLKRAARFFSPLIVTATLGSLIYSVVILLSYLTRPVINRPWFSVLLEVAAFPLVTVGCCAVILLGVLSVVWPKARAERQGLSEEIASLVRQRE